MRERGGRKPQLLTEEEVRQLSTQLQTVEVSTREKSRIHQKVITTFTRTDDPELETLILTLEGFVKKSQA